MSEWDRQKCLSSITWYSSLGRVLCLVTQLCPTLSDPMDYSLPGSSVHGDFPGKNTVVGCHALLQRIFPAQGSNPGLQHYRWILYCLNHAIKKIYGGGLVAKSCRTLCNPMDCSLPGSSVHGDFPGKNIGVGCHALLQGIFPTQGSNPDCCGFFTFWTTREA